MKLKFAGSPEVRASQARVWEALLDPEFVAASAPGVDRVEILTAEHYRLHVGIGVAFLKVHVAMDVRMHDLEPPERARLAATGGGPGTEVTLESHVRIEPMGPDRQRLHWEAEADVHGTLAQFGARLLEGVVRSLTEDFWNNFARRVSAAP